MMRRPRSAVTRPPRRCCWRPSCPRAGLQAADACKGTIYLTFDTGSQSQAELIADTLRRHHIKATFFLANEKTVRGDWSLDPSWAGFWKARVAEGHAFGTHTFDHVYWKRDEAGGTNIASNRSSARMPASSKPGPRSSTATSCAASTPASMS
jgi:hypothetical protein